MTIVLRELEYDYEPSFLLLVDDFRRLLTYVEPVNSNLSCYSHRSFELLLRACTEFESLAKDALVKIGHTKSPNSMTMSDFRSLNEPLELEQVRVGVNFWRPRPTHVRPFENFSNPKIPVRWYADYNKVKHNRTQEFHRASIENVRQSIAALFALMVKCHIPNIVGVTQLGKIENGWKENTISKHPYSSFTIISPYPAAT